MQLYNLPETLKKWDGFAPFLSEMSKPHSNFLTVCGPEHSGAAFFCYAFEAINGKKCIYVAKNDFEAKTISEDLNSFTGGRAALLERSEFMFYDVEARSGDTEAGRMETIRRIETGDCDFVVLSAECFIQFMPKLSSVTGANVSLAPGFHAEPLDIADRLAKIGYIRVPHIDGKKQFAVRGDILDVFPTSAKNPYRIEFYGDEIDSVRIFDEQTQRTIENAGKVEILAETEITTVSPEEIEKRILESLDAKLRTIPGERSRRQFESRVLRDIAAIKDGASFPGRDRYMPFMTGREYTILDYLPDADVFVGDIDSVKSTIDAALDEHMKMCASIDESVGILPELYTMFMDSGEAEEKLKNRGAVKLESFVPPDFKGYVFRTETIGGAEGNLALIDAQFDRFKKEKITLTILCSSEAREERMRALASDRGAETIVQTAAGSISKGFVAPDCGFALMGDSAFTGKTKTAKARKKHESDIDFFADLHEGDLVVHDVHGIGVFSGFRPIEVDGVTKDYIVIKYAEGGVLYLPSYQLDTIHKFIGDGDSAPKLNTLGSPNWQKAKQKVKDSLREYVDELVQLYAKRSKMKGYAFPQDDTWQKEFEDAFEFEPTDDQLTCAEEIKRDMEKPTPMERLLCGDVGFGKTEVAVRAAFKAVISGKQVAFLVPTTVLAYQHYKTLLKRFEGYPVKVDYLCRLRSPQEQKKILADLTEGRIDILIGTHSILQNKAIFKDLGLIIVDEEQRFGVMQKEKLKMKWPGTDMLTLSATPIPRTLHMSLSGIRDISLLTDPPMDRNPVQTYVLEMNPEVIKNAIYREMARSGQIFYLYNSVQHIEEKRLWIKSLVPEARIGIAHGQMVEKEIEGVMESFAAGEYDILLCTTIIESGLDFPNANTIVVEDGHRLGLAQLYQIRGRVGRSYRRAYAYITYPQSRQLGEEAEKRLQTIKEFTEFGSGFKIALRDLEIRGAGSVLGEKQHGQLAAVGYDMYCRLLASMITEAEGGTAKEDVVINIDFNMNSYIPESYVAESDERLDLYRKIALVRNDEDIRDLTDELIDRFGSDIPRNVINLMHVSKIRTLAAEAGINSIIQRGDSMQLYIGQMKEFERKYSVVRDAAEEKYGRHHIIYDFSAKKPSLTIEMPGKKQARNAETLLKYLEDFLSCVAGETVVSSQ